MVISGIDSVDSSLWSGYPDVISNSHKHVAIICPGCGGTGAVANVAVHHAIELEKYFQVFLVSDSFPEDIPGVDQIPLRPFRFGMLRRFAHVPREVAFALAAKAAVARRHAEKPIDFIICHGHPVATLAAKPLKARLGIPFGLVAHGDIFDRPRGTYDSRLTWFYCQVTAPAYKSADLVMALSPQMRQMAIRGGALAERVFVIPNGIDASEIGLRDAVPLLPKGATDRLELLYIGRLAIEKGVDVLLDAAAALSARGVNFRLRVVGDGPESNRLQSFAADQRLDRVVDFLGPIPRKQLGSFYRSADIVCVPSRSDPLPTVVLEAMASGVAVMGTDVGGIPFMVNHGKTGWVVPREDSKAMATVIESCARNPDELLMMKIVTQAVAANQFSWQITGMRIAETVSRLIGNWKNLRFVSEK